MTATIHDTSVQIDVFPDEFEPILKVLYFALLTPDKFYLTEKEIETLHNFQVDFNLSALNYAE
jgi:hypothetical protein